MAQTSIIATIMASRTQRDPAASAAPRPRPSRTEIATDADREDGGAPDDLPERRVAEELGVVVQADPLGGRVPHSWRLLVLLQRHRQPSGRAGSRAAPASSTTAGSASRYGVSRASRRASRLEPPGASPPPDRRAGVACLRVDRGRSPSRSPATSFRWSVLHGSCPTIGPRSGRRPAARARQIWRWAATGAAHRRS